MPNTGSTADKLAKARASDNISHFTRTVCKLGWELKNDESLTCTSGVGVSGWVGAALAPGVSGCVCQCASQPAWVELWQTVPMLKNRFPLFCRPSHLSAHSLPDG